MQPLSDAEIVSSLGFCTDIIPLFETVRSPQAQPFHYVSMIRWPSGPANMSRIIMQIADDLRCQLEQHADDFALLFRRDHIHVLTQKPLQWNAVLVKLATNLTVSQCVPFDVNAAIRADLPSGVIMHDPKIIAFMGEGTI